MSYRFYCGGGVAAGVNLICGLLVAALSSAHLIAVSLRRIELKAPYDFRIYSLLLFGAVVLAGRGVTAIRATAGIARGEIEAGRSASWAMLGVAGYGDPGHASSGDGSGLNCSCCGCLGFYHD